MAESKHTKSPDPTTEPRSVFTPGPWVFSTASGRLPVVREVKMPHGEAPTFKTLIRGKGDELGPHVCTLDFGYGQKTDLANARRIVTAVNCHDDLLTSCRELRDALAACMRFAEALGFEVQFVKAMHDAGIQDGIGVRADAAIVCAEGL